MTHPWREAARLYEANRPSHVADAKAPVAEGGTPDIKAEMEKLAFALEQFIASDEGVAAMELLRASGREVPFEGVTDGDYWDRHLLNGYGLRSSSGNAWRERDKEVQADIRNLAEKTIYRRNEKTAEAVMSWLRGELNKIAAEAIRPVS